MPFGQNVEQTIMNNIDKAHGSTIPSLATSKVLPQVGFSDMGIFWRKNEFGNDTYAHKFYFCNSK